MPFCASVLRRTLLALLLALTAAPALACGPDSDCKVGDRIYRIRLPDGVEPGTPIGAVVFAHGYRGSAAGVMNNAQLGRAIADLGLALIAPEAAADDWSIANAPSHSTGAEVDEPAYFAAVVADAVARFGLDPDRVYMAGFSAGGMMTWTLACLSGDLFAGFAPISGTFWAPLPESCPSAPVNLVHIHGTDDPVVPMAGRAIAETRQGDVADAFGLFLEEGDFAEDGGETAGDLDCTRWTNPEDRLMELCLHPGGHRYEADEVTYAIGVLDSLATQ
ncbi:MAG: hypothetical protein KDA64_11200 [Rhodospirillaceae bacterium]|nr:hypothetical protein [Rhodospirillaceae bacterium]